MSSYLPFVGATKFANGKQGLVPAPRATATPLVLCSNGTWVSAGGVPGVSSLPNQAGHNGHFLKSNGTIASWNSILVADITGTMTVAKGGTGITSYTKGDILVATGAATLVKLAVGADGTALKADSAQASGVKWDTVAPSTRWEPLTNGIDELVFADGDVIMVELPL